MSRYIKVEGDFVILGGDPTSNNALVPTTAPIQPPQAFVDVMTVVFNNGCDEFYCPNLGITFISLELLRNWLYMSSNNGGTKTINISGNALDANSINGILAQLASQSIGNGTLDISGQTPPAPPTKQVVTYQNGVASYAGEFNGHPSYLNTAFSQETFRWEGTQWARVSPEDDFAVVDVATSGETDYPWNATGWANPIIGANAAVLALQANGWTVTTD